MSPAFGTSGLSSVVPFARVVAVPLNSIFFEIELFTILLIGIMVFAMQYLTLLLLSKMIVAYALALFQLGMVIQVFVGYKVFDEKHIARKLLAATVMMMGSMLVLMA